MAFDLDDEELASTRRLHGLDKKKDVPNVYVGDIEKAIKILKEKVAYCKSDVCEYDESELVGAIEIVLGNLDALCNMQRVADKELEDARKINEEHKKQNAELMKALNIAEKEKGEWIKEYQKLKEENKNV